MFLSEEHKTVVESFELLPELRDSESELVTKGFEEDPSLVICYLSVKDFAQQFLGRVHHICTNDFLSRTGAVVWTDHGFQHSMRIWDHISVLLGLDSCQEVTVKGMYALACAALLHDVGMFFRHPDFPDLAVQRKYHGKVARCVFPMVEAHIAQMENCSEPDVKKCSGEVIKVFQKIKNLVAEICELHQSKVKLKSPRDTDEVYMLGNLLLMADALDVCQDRVRLGKGVLDLVDRVTTISGMSSDQWWVNDCVDRTLVERQNKNDLRINVEINSSALTEWYKKATGIESPLTQEMVNTLVGHLREYLNRYIGEHYDAAEKRKSGQFGAVSWVFRLDNGTQFSDIASQAPYDKLGQIWADHLPDYELKALVTPYLEPIKKSLVADSVYLFVFDEPSESIRYLPGDAFYKMNDLGNTRDRTALERQRIPNKCGIIGHVAYCGIPSLVDDLAHDPRRCYSDEDKHLGLNSVIFSPVVEEARDEKTHEPTKTLWAVVMANRRVDDGGTNRFNKDDRDKLNDLVSQQVQPIAAHLKQFSTQ